jgi:uncharacterized protein
VRKVVYWLAMLGLCVAPALHAQSPALPASAAAQDVLDRSAAAEELMVVMNIDDQFTAIIPQVVTLMLGIFVQGNVGREDQVRVILGEEMNTAYSARIADFRKLTRDTYSRNFTAEQLRDLTAFYRTPTGQVLLKKMPLVAQESMQGGAEIGRKAAADAMPHILRRMQASRLSVPKGI